MNYSSDETQFNVHSATNEDQCIEMGQLNQWELVRVEPTEDSILTVDCYFNGEQTSFEDERYGD